MAVSLPLILDCDNTFGIPGCDVDDALALLYLLGRPEVRLLGVTCSYGNSTQEAVYRATRELTARWGLSALPVLRGADGPAKPGSDAAEFLAEMSRRYEGSLRIVATGAMTNLLGAETADPGFFSRTAAFSLMGGVTEPLRVGGRPMKELNFSCDGAAAYAVLSQGRNIRLAAAQNCLASFFPKASLRELRQCAAPACRALVPSLEDWIGVYERDWGLSGFVCWDVMAAAQLLQPALFELRKETVSPTPSSLTNGVLRGGGTARTLTLPAIRQTEEYRRHIFQTWLSAPILSAEKTQ